MKLAKFNKFFAAIFFIFLSTALIGKISQNAFAASPQTILEYNLNEGAGTNANDSSGMANNGVFVRGPSWVAGKSGTGVQFRNINSNGEDYINGGSQDSLDNLAQGDFTGEAWVKFLTIPVHPRVAYFGIMNKLVGEENGWMFNMTSHVDGTWNMYFRQRMSIRSVYYVANINVQAGQWHHVAFTYSSSDKKPHLYFDGQEAAYQRRGSGAGVPVDDSSANLKVGLYRVTNFPHVLDDVRLYNYALSAGEIQDLAKAKILEYKLDEGIGITTEDTSGYDNDGVFVRGPSWVAGKSGTGVQFRNINSNGEDYINGGSKAILDNLAADDFSGEAWVKFPTMSPHSNNRYFGIMSKKIGEEQGWMWNMTSLPNGTWNMYFRQQLSGPHVYYTAPVGVVIGQWHHVAFTYDGQTRNVHMYFDGQETSYERHANGIGSPVDDSSGNLRVGLYKATTFLHVLDCIGLYKSLLNPAAILQSSTNCGGALIVTPTATPTASPTQTPTPTPTPVSETIIFINNQENASGSNLIDIPHGYKSMTVEVTTTGTINKWAPAPSFDGGITALEQHKFECENNICSVVTIPLLSDKYKINLTGATGTINVSATLNEEPNAEVIVLGENVDYPFESPSFKTDDFNTITITAGDGEFPNLSKIILQREEGAGFVQKAKLICDGAAICPLQSLPLLGGEYRVVLEATGSGAVVGAILRP